MATGSIGILAEQILEEVRATSVKTAEQEIVKEASARIPKTELGLALKKLAALVRETKDVNVSMGELQDFVKRMQ